jgi:hypothetical protein
MIRNAPNFDIEPGVPVTGHPIPTISYFTSRAIQVQTSIGLRAATEVTIFGANFLIRAVEPDVLINGQPLAVYRIADDFQSITGYFFGTLTHPVQIIVDYGLGVRGEWTEPVAITIAFCSPQYYLLNLNRLPRGTVLIGGVNFNVPVSTTNVTAIKLALQGGASPLQRLNEEFVAAQLSLNFAGGSGSPTAFSALQGHLSNYGLNFAPVTLSNGFPFTPNSTLNDLFEQARLAIRDQRTQDMPALADIFDLLNGNAPQCPGLGRR